MTETAENKPASAEPIHYDINDIMRILPHRYPMLLIDRVVELVRRQRLVAIKNVTINEPFFIGHFPGAPIMPGVLIVEAMAQAGGALLLTEVPDRDQKLIVFTGIEKAKFRRQVVPGDQVRIEVQVLAWREGSGRKAVRMQGKAYVDGKVAAEAILSCQLVPKPGSAGSQAEDATPE